MMPPRGVQLYHHFIIVSTAQQVTSFGSGSGLKLESMGTKRTSDGRVSCTSTLTNIMFSLTHRVICTASAAPDVSDTSKYI
jgi:hypothetical protein